MPLTLCSSNIPGVQRQSAGSSWFCYSLLIFACLANFSAAAQTLAAGPLDTSQQRPIEEVVVTAINRCGPWPIAHINISTCTYPELKREQLHTILSLRPTYLNQCLSCSNGHCQPRSMLTATRQVRLECKRLFQTAKTVPRVQLGRAYSGYLNVEFSFDISTQGRVENVQIIYLQSKLSEQTVLTLIQRGAAKTQFEPLTYDGTAVGLTNLKNRYLLER